MACLIQPCSLAGNLRLYSYIVLPSVNSHHRFSLNSFHLSYEETYVVSSIHEGTASRKCQGIDKLA